MKQKKKKLKPNKSSQQKSSKSLSSSNELKLSSQSAKSSHVDPPDHGQVLSHSDQQLKVRKVARGGEFVNEPNFTTKAKSPQVSYCTYMYMYIHILHVHVGLLFATYI